MPQNVDEKVFLKRKWKYPPIFSPNKYRLDSAMKRGCITLALECQWSNTLQTPLTTVSNKLAHKNTEWIEKALRGLWGACLTIIFNTISKDVL